MRNWIVFFLWIGIWMAGPGAAVGDVDIPRDPIFNNKLRTIQEKVYFAGWDGLYRSSNGGDSYQKIRSYQPTDGFQLFE